MTRRASRMLMGVLSVTTLVGVTAYAITHRLRAEKKRTGTVFLAANGGATTKPSEAADAQTAGHTAPPPITQIGPATRPLVNPLPPIVAPKNALTEGKAKIDSGDLPAGRKLLNDALMGGQLGESDAAAARQLIADANKTLIFAPRRYNDDPWCVGHTVAPGENLQKIARENELTPELLLRINGLANPRNLRAGATIKVIKGPFHAVVTKHAFTLDVYLGSPAEKNAQYVVTYPVGLGKDDSTPSGSWIVEVRIPNPKWWGARGVPGVEAGDPKNPLGKFWIGLAGIDGKAEGQQSYGIHGTIEPQTIGKQASMGCIRMRNEDVAIVYELLVTGRSTVVVKD